ncbi:MAG: hypothetical protein LBG91_00700 [Treponema sp.]|jgi:riboflavin kinase/FMN adenylyltransferase|nr:hypothetical protein [Treponema sp.]
MLIIEWPQFLKNGLPVEQKFSSMTVGVFDGVHRGHRLLIERVVSHNTGNVPVVVTFVQNHKAKEKAHNILSFRQKTAIFEKLGIEITLVIDFTESFRRMSGTEFLNILLEHGKAGFLAVGNNFRCGYRLDTNAAAIQQFFSSRNVPVEIVPEVTEDSLSISSSRIRSAIAAGNLPQTRKMLQAPYTIDLAEPTHFVLPPPGKYQVILRKRPEDEGTRAALLIEGETIRIPEPFTDADWEFAEFATEPAR